MNQTQIPEEVIKKWEIQYHNLHETIISFEEHMHGRRYRKSFNRNQRKTIRNQLRFYKKALNLTIKRLIEAGSLNDDLSYLALRNRSISPKIKFMILQYKYNGHSKRI